MRASVLGALAPLALAASALTAQESLLPTSSFGTAPVLTAWHFATPIAQSSGAVADVAQFALPVHARTVLGERWTFDLIGAASVNALHVTGGDEDRILTLNGLTDVKLRMSGGFNDNKLLITAGLNLPTGTTKLNADQTSVLQAIGAPGLHMPVNALGIGTGVTLGAVQAVERDQWAFALGGSVEQRTEYTPIALALASGQSLTKIAPGTAVHVTLGSDHTIGDSQLAMLVIGDWFSQDQVHLTAPSTATTSSQYTLGPQVTALARYNFAASGWRESAIGTTVRYRTAFTDASGAKVDGSAGSYVEGAINAIRGGATGAGFIIGADVRYHSGLSFTDALVGMAVKSAGVTLGVDLPTTGVVSRLALRGEYGQFNTGTTSTNGMGLSLVWAIAARQEAR